MKSHASRYFPVAHVMAAVVALTLSGCGKPQHIELIGIRYGMTLDEVKADSPDGVSLYCQGDGDAAFDVHFPRSGTTTYCAWTRIDASGTRTYSTVAFGDAQSFEQDFEFSRASGQYTLEGFKLKFRDKAFDPNVALLTKQLGKPEPSPLLDTPFISYGVQWAGGDGTLIAWNEPNATAYPPMSGLFLTKPANKPS